MFNPKPKGGDGASISDVPLRLGELYCFTLNSKQLSSDLAIPQRWYGIVESYQRDDESQAIRLHSQRLPALETTIQLDIQKIMTLVEDGLLHLKHYPVNYRNNSYETIKHKLITTQEHFDLVAQNPELLGEWKLLCLYEPPDNHVKSTYLWLIAQNWFDINLNEIDWTLLTYQLLDLVDQPNDDDYDPNGGTFPASI